MRTVTTTLLAAQRAVSQEPRVAIIIRDKQPRFEWIGSEDVADVGSAMTLAGNGSIVVAALDADGKVYVRVVDDPTVLDPTGTPGIGWGWWPNDYVEIADGALGWPDGDVAISNNGGTIRVFYANAAGNTLYCKESTDNGENWGAAVTVASGLTASTWVRLSSCGRDDVELVASAYKYGRYHKKASGVWGYVGTLSSLTGGASTCNGITSVWWPAESKIALAVAIGCAAKDGGGGSIRTGLMTEAGVLDSVQKIVPPGTGVSSSFEALWPSLALDQIEGEERWLLTYTDKYTGSGGSWKTPVCIMSRDFDHWSYKIPLGFDTMYEKRYALVAGDGTTYAHHVNEAYSLSQEYAELEIGQERVLRYKIDERGEDGELTVLLDNRDGFFDSPGVEGADAEILRPLAGVVVDQGLLTSVGAEQVESRPFYLWSVTRVRSEKENWAEIYALDGWELLRMWRPDTPYYFTRKTVRWLIEEIAARAGYFEVEFDSSSEWDTVIGASSWVSVTRLVLKPAPYLGQRTRVTRLVYEPVAYGEESTGLAILRQLLGVVGGMARWGNGDNRDVLYCFIPYKQGESPTAVHTYNDGEVLEGEYVDGFAWPTRVRATGAEDSRGVRPVYQTQDVADGIAAGMDFFTLLQSDSWATVGMCEDVAQALMDAADAGAWGGVIKTRPNVGLELFDVIVFSDTLAGAGVVGAKRRVSRLVTEYQPLKRVWEQKVYLEGV